MAERVKESLPLAKLSLRFDLIQTISRQPTSAGAPVVLLGSQGRISKAGSLDPWLYCRVRGDDSLLRGPALCIEQCLIASLASTMTGQ